MIRLNVNATCMSKLRGGEQSDGKIKNTSGFTLLLEAFAMLLINNDMAVN